VIRPPTDRMRLTRELLLCAWPQCKEMTNWKAPRQSKRGTCIDHAESAAERSLGETLGVLLSAFPGAVVSVPDPPRRWHRGEYPTAWSWVLVRTYWPAAGRHTAEWVATPPLDAGPCEDCRALVCRYGSYSYPYCYECDEVRNATANRG
jgi:hypothetical protein